MLLALLVEKLRDEGEAAEEVDNDEHNNIPPTGMFSVDGTKIGSFCAASLHNKGAALLYVGKVDCRAIHEEEIFCAGARPA